MAFASPVGALTSGTSTDVGGLVYLPDQYANVVTLNGQTLLRTGKLVSDDGSYSGVHAITGNKTKVLYGTTAPILSASSIAATNAFVGSIFPVAKIGSQYVGGSAAGNALASFYYYSTSLSAQSWTSISFLNMEVIYDTVITPGGRVLLCGYNTGGTGYVGHTTTAGTPSSGITAIALSASVAYLSGAINPSGTIAVICSSSQNAAGVTYTSANETTWTIRTPTGFGASANIHLCHWMPVSSTFVMVCTGTSGIYTTPDGFTMTSRTVPTGYSGPTRYNGRAKAASSATATVIGGANGTLMRTTDGVNFSRVTLPSADSLIGATFGQPPQTAIETFVSYVDGAFWVGGGSNAGTMWVSYDDGATFIAAWIPADSLVAGQFSPLNVSKMGSEYCVSVSGMNFQRYMLSPDGVTPKHVGIPQALTGGVFTSGTPAYTGLAAYVRIK